MSLKVMSYIYSGNGISYNARIAKEDGRLPITQAIERVYRKIHGYYKINKQCIKKLVLSFGETGEWHHTGLYGKRTPFYDTNEVLKVLGVNID